MHPIYLDNASTSFPKPACDRFVSDYKFLHKYLLFLFHFCKTY